MVIGITWARGKGSTLECKNKYPILGRPLIWYPLTSLKHSNTVDFHYVFTEDDDIADITLQAGWQVIPRPRRFVSYRDKNFDYQSAWKLITTHIAADRGVSVPVCTGDWVTSFHRLSEVAFSLNCNNCMLRSETFQRMRSRMTDKDIPAVYPAVRFDDHLMMGHPDGYLFPVWHAQGMNRQYYPPLFRALLSTSFTNAWGSFTGRPNYYYCEIDAMEAMDVHDRLDIDIIEAYLERHPGHFGWSFLQPPGSDTNHRQTDPTEGPLYIAHRS